MNENESSGSGMFLLGAVAGALVGAGVALLMAPKPGAEMRQDLNAGLDSLRDAAARRYREMADRAGVSSRTSKRRPTSWPISSRPRPAKWLTRRRPRLKHDRLAAGTTATHAWCQRRARHS